MASIVFFVLGLVAGNAGMLAFQLSGQARIIAANIAAVASIAIIGGLAFHYV